MANVLRVALPGYNALTDTDPSHFSLFTDSDNVLIKEYERGTGTGTTTINHNLGYVPFYLIYGETSAGSGTYRLIGQYTLHDDWRVYANDTDIEIVDSIGGRDFKYFIFYDDMV